MQQLSEVEKQALKTALQSPEFCSAFRKTCENQSEFYTRKVLSEQNRIPENVDQDVKRRAVQAMFGGMAKAYGAILSELEKAAE